MDKDKKLYRVTTNRCGDFYAIATSFDEAANAVEKALTNSDYGTFESRKVNAVQLIAIEHFFPDDKQFFSGSNNNLIIVKEE